MNTLLALTHFVEEKGYTAIVEIKTIAIKKQGHNNKITVSINAKGNLWLVPSTNKSSKEIELTDPLALSRLSNFLKKHFPPKLDSLKGGID